MSSNTQIPKDLKYYEFPKCDKCGATPAIYRDYCKKTLCTECHKKEIEKIFIAIVTSGGAIILLIISIIYS